MVHCPVDVRLTRQVSGIQQGLTITVDVGELVECHFDIHSLCPEPPEGWQDHLRDYVAQKYPGWVLQRIVY